MHQRALVLFSGGQDSTTCLAWALARYAHVETVAFDYGQRHAIELAVRPRVLAALRAAYSLATVAFIGGSIASRGGHNVLEPASLGIAVVTGAHTENFAAITKALLDENAVVQLPNLETSQASTELASVLRELLADEARRLEIGRRALTVCNQNRGATERTIQVIEEILAARAATDTPVPFPALHVTAAK